MRDSTIVTKELLFGLEACTESIYAIKNRNMWGRPISEILDMLEQEGIDNAARSWWAEQEVTENFVRLTGSVIKMDKFKVFDPLIGQHVEFTDIELAKQKMLEAATEILKKHTPRIIAEISNEHGDAAWIETDEHLKLIANFSNEGQTST